LDSADLRSRLEGNAGARRALVAALLLALAVQSVASMRLLSATSDETSHLPSGYTYLATGEIRLNRQHPPLVKLLAALPLLTLSPRLDLDDPAYRSEPPDEWKFGYRFLYSNDADALLFRGRLAIVLLALLGGVYTYLLARDVFGAEAGVAAVFLYCFCPGLIAHSHLVTMDVPLAAFATGTFFHLRRFVRDGERAQAIASTVLLGCALATKFSAVLFVPVIAGLVLTATWRRGPLRAAATLGAILIGALAIVWALYFFPGDPLFYWRGLTSVNRDHDPAYRYFLMGEFREGGFPTYFLWVFLLKTPLPVLALLAWAAIRFARGPRRDALDEAFVLAPGLFFFAGTVAAADDMGVRYLLPAYPFLFAFASRSARDLLRSRAGRIAGAALAVWTLVTAVRIYPDHLAYFHELAGGPSRGHRYLDDSNVDWGQDLKRLAARLRDEKIEKVRLLYAWNGSPDYYGISYEPVTKRDWEQEPRPGVYAISTMWLIHGMDTAARTGVKTDWLRRYRPFGRVGYSFFLYRIPER
jgi:hypothetical protein